MIRKLAWLALLVSPAAMAQTTTTLHNSAAAILKIDGNAEQRADAALPSAPIAQNGGFPAAIPNQPQQSNPYPTQQPIPNSPPQTTTTGGAGTLSIKQAEQLALKNNPQISVARLTAFGFAAGHA
jgi:hypothetical protein